MNIWPTSHAVEIPVKTFVPEADRVDWIVVVDAGQRSHE